MAAEERKGRRCRRAECVGGTRASRLSWSDSLPCAARRTAVPMTVLLGSGGGAGRAGGTGTGAGLGAG